MVQIRRSSYGNSNKRHWMDNCWWAYVYPAYHVLRDNLSRMDRSSKIKALISPVPNLPAISSFARTLWVFLFPN